MAMGHGVIPYWIDHYQTSRFSITLRNFYSLTLRTVAEHIAVSEGRSLNTLLATKPNLLHNLFGRDYLGSERSYTIWTAELPSLAKLKEDFRADHKFNNPPVFTLHLQTDRLGDDVYFNDQAPVEIVNVNDRRVTRNGIFRFMINLDPDLVPEDELYEKSIHIVPEPADRDGSGWSCWSMLCCSKPPVAELTVMQVKQLTDQLRRMIMHYGAAPGMPIAVPGGAAADNPVFVPPPSGASRRVVPLDSPDPSAIQTKVTTL